LGARSPKVRVGSLVKHLRLGKGVIIEFCKFGGVLVNYSDDKGVLVRVSHISTLEIIDE